MRLQTPCRNPKSYVQLAAAFWSPLTTTPEGALCVQPFVYLGSSSFSF